MTEHDQFADWDAGYLLGALSGAERRAYEDHLERCAECRAAVGDLAAMPGLLAQLPKAEAIALDDDHPYSVEDQGGAPVAADPGQAAVAADLPESIRTMRAPTRSDRTRTAITMITIAVTIAALLIGGAVGYLVRGATEPGPAPSTAAPSPSAAAPSALRLAFVPVRSTSMIAIADLARDGSGTMITIECQYPSGQYPPSGPYPGGSASPGATSVGYVLYVIDDYGTRSRGPSWTAGPGERVTQQMQLPKPMSKISTLEIADSDSGDVVVRARM